MINVHTVTGTSPASASTAALGLPVMGLARFSQLKVVASLLGATGGVLDVYLQWTPDAGTTWYDYAHFTQLTNGNAAVIQTCGFGFGSTTPTTIGTALVPALAAGTCVGGSWGDGLRVVCVAGSGTSAGAALSIKFYLS